jgi:hypothetical protein
MPEVVGKGESAGPVRDDDLDLLLVEWPGTGAWPGPNPGGDLADLALVVRVGGDDWKAYIERKLATVGPYAAARAGAVRPEDEATSCSPPHHRGSAA